MSKTWFSRVKSAMQPKTTEQNTSGSPCPRTSEDDYAEALASADRFSEVFGAPHIGPNPIIPMPPPKSPPVSYYSIRTFTDGPRPMHVLVSWPDGSPFETYHGEMFISDSKDLLRFRMENWSPFDRFEEKELSNEDK